MGPGQSAGKCSSGITKVISLIKSKEAEEDGRIERYLDLVPVIELDILLAYPAVEGHPRVHGPGLGGIGLSRPYAGGVHAEEQRESYCEAGEGDEHPMLPHPEDQLDIIAVPAVAQMVGEETPRVVVVLVREEDADSVVALRVSVVVVSPDYAQEEGSGGGHDGDVWQNPPAIVIWEGVDSLEEEGVAGDGAHGVVGDARGCRAADPGWVCQEGVEAAVASL